MKFVVTKLRDAYVEYWIEVEADTINEAVTTAKQSRKWERGSVREYDDTIYPPDEVYMLRDREVQTVE